MLRTLLLTGLVFAVLAGAAWAEESKDSKKKVTYVDDLTPVLRAKCFQCHNADRTSGGLNMTTYTGLMTGGSSGEVISAGDSGGSYLYKLVTHTEQPSMPPNSPKIDEKSIEIIRLWIDGGALETVNSKPKLSNKPKVDLALDSVSTGRPEGPPPMPGKLSLEPIVRTERANSITGLATSPWAPLAAVAGYKQILLWNTDTLELSGVLPFPEGVPQDLKFSRNGKMLLAGGGRGAELGKVVVYSVESGERVIEVGDEWDSVLAADMNSQQTLIALGGPDKIVRIYSTVNGELVTKINKHTDWVTAIEFSPDGVLLATADRAGGLHIWEGYTGRAYLTLDGHKGAVTGLSWRRDSNLLASCAEDNQVKLWEMNRGNQVRNWNAHNGVQHVHFGHDGKLVTCGRDKVAKLWQGDGKQIRQFPAMPDVAMKTALTHDGKRVIVGDWSGQVSVFNAEDGKEIGQLSANPPTLAERMEVAQAAVAKAKAEYAKVLAVAHSSQMAADELRMKAHNLQEVLKQTPGKVKQAQQELSKQQQQVKDHTNKLRAAQQVLTQAEAEVKKAEDELEKAKDQPEDKQAPLKQKLQAAQAKAQAASKQVQEQQAVIEKAKQQVAAAEKAKQGLEQQLAATKKSLDDLQPKLKAAEEKAKADQAAAEAAAAKIKAAEAALGKWKDAVAFHQEYQRKQDQVTAR